MLIFICIPIYIYIYIYIYILTHTLTNNHIYIYIYIYIYKMCVSLSFTGLMLMLNLVNKNIHISAFQFSLVALCINTEKNGGWIIKLLHVPITYAAFFSHLENVIKENFMRINSWIPSISRINFVLSDIFKICAQLFYIFRIRNPKDLPIYTVQYTIMDW